VRLSPRLRRESVAPAPRAAGRPQATGERENVCALLRYYDLDDAFAAPLKAAYGPRCIERPFVVAPAMNTFMRAPTPRRTSSATPPPPTEGREPPPEALQTSSSLWAGRWHQRVTSQHVEVLAGRGVHVVPPVSKTLACGAQRALLPPLSRRAAALRLAACPRSPPAARRHRHGRDGFRRGHRPDHSSLAGGARGGGRARQKRGEADFYAVTRES